MAINPEILFARQTSDCHNLAQSFEFVVAKNVIPGCQATFTDTVSVCPSVSMSDSIVILEILPH